MSFFSESITRDKLILLYFLDSTGFELTNSQISRIASENEWDDYFSFQQSISDLAQVKLINEIPREIGTYYSISMAGKETLKQFIARLPQSIRSEIDQYSSTHRERISKSIQHVAAVERIKTDEYIASLSLVEESSILFELRINLPSIEAATTICNRWGDKAQDIYQSVLAVLASDKS